MKDHPHSAERPDTWLSLTKNRWIAKIRRSPNHFWAWISNSKNRQPLGVYSGTAPVACIAFFGTITTFGMAYGFSTYSFDFTSEAIRHWGVVLCLVLISIGLQVLREQALEDRTEKAEEESKRAQEDLASKQQDLISLLKTMPPAHALSTFTESYKATLFQWRFRPVTDSSSSTAEKEKAIEFIQRNIRFSLNAAAQLFLHYEHKPLNTKCSAHLTEYITVNDITDSPQLMARVKAGIRFIDDDRDPLRGLKGVLHVDPAMSAFAKPGMEQSDAREPDPKLKEEIFLPVADCDDEDPDSTRSRAIPIAPRAFRFGQVIYKDVEYQITHEASKNWNVTQNVIDKVLEYVAGTEHGRIGSAAAYRLLWEYQSREGERVDLSQFAELGVLTIFTETPANMSEDVVSAYWDLVRPIIELQKEQLLAIMDLRS